ncbi:hypothetical protein Fcan01_20925 [Folsomia candida]|uniref:Uncharacterized protein n=1 Tax=Folsomia candida TaxID=158441 RepID=A0A226DIK7_FOLCA|nr:hypothetical protein Fcan01_20925 [Folsomia candida]
MSRISTTHKTGSNIIPFTVEGIPDLAHIKAQFAEKILNSKDPAGDGPLYPELRQTIVSWGGYFFWADLPNFTLPIRLLDIDPIDIDSNEGISLLRTLYNRE